MDRKPVNFITQIDKLFKRYFKSDSLLYSETLHAVKDGDAHRTFIIHGPVAARHVCKKNETVAGFLDGICDGLKQKIRSGATLAALEAPDPQRLRGSTMRRAPNHQCRKQNCCFLFR